MDWQFLVVLALMVPVVFLPPAFLLLRPKVKWDEGLGDWNRDPSTPSRHGRSRGG